RLWITRPEAPQPLVPLDSPGQSSGATAAAWTQDSRRGNSTMRAGRATLSICLAAALSSCGGGGGATASPAPAPTPTPTAAPTPTPSPTSAACSLSARKSWALEQLQEWYLFPDLFNASANPAAHATVQDYIDALVAPARAQSRDRYFTYVTSI